MIWSLAGDYKKAATVLGELAKTGDEKVKGLALLKKAQALQEGGSTKEATATYAELVTVSGDLKYALCCDS